MTSLPMTSLRRLPAAILAAALLLAALPLAAREPAEISPALLRDLRASCPDTPEFRSVRNALAQTDGPKVALDPGRTNAVDAFFSKRLADQHITDQKSSGRCWMFSGLNLLRPAARKSLGTEKIEFSQNFMFFYDKLEKSNLFLEAVTGLKDRPYTDRMMEFLFKQPVQDGGNWLGFIELIKKYGVVPKEVMPETFSSSNTRHVNQILATRLRQYALRIRAAGSDSMIASLKARALKDVYRILALNFGLPPEKFTWRYEKTDKSLAVLRAYTPLQFYREFVGTALDDYFALYSVPTLPFLKKYEIELDKAINDRPAMYFVNVPLADLKTLALTMLTNDEPVWFGCDVGQEFCGDSGLLACDVYDFNSLYGMDLRMDRRELFETYSSTPGHNMVFTGVDLVDGKPAKWLVENSWGEKSGKKGYLTMTDDWFDKYVQVVVVHRKYLPAQILEAFARTPETLPPWDPMYKMLTD